MIHGQLGQEFSMVKGHLSSDCKVTSAKIEDRPSVRRFQVHAALTAADIEVPSINAAEGKT